MDGLINHHRKSFFSSFSVIILFAACSFAAITPQIAPSRVSGVAPLAVYVDATATGGLDGNDYINANFDWNFDRDGVDPSGKHTVTRGFVAAHVYEAPGTYTIQLVVHDRLGAGAVSTTQVVVSPFTGTTYYVAAGGNNTAAGTSMTSPLATADYAILKKGGPNTRILLRSGDRFTIPALGISKTGPMIVGSYSDPNAPSAVLPILYCADDGWGILNINGGRDCRFVDLHLRSSPASIHENIAPNERGVTIGDSTADILFLRMEIDSVGRDAIDGNGLNTFIFDCNYHDYGTYGFYSAGVNRFAMVGTLSRRLGDGQHFIRIQGGSKAFIAYNDDAESDVNYDEITFRGNTSQVYALGNRIDRMMSFHPQNQTAVERLSYCVADGNLLRNSGVLICAKHVAVRNNLLYNSSISLENSSQLGPDSISDDVAILNNSFYGNIDDMVSGGAMNVVIKNNIFHTTTIDGWASGLALSNPLSNYLIDNNIYFAPKKGGPLWFSAEGVTINGGAFGTWQAKGADVHSKMVDPIFVSVDSASPNFLKLGAGSPAVGAGAVVPVFEDFAGKARAPGQSTDAGAWLYTSANVHFFTPFLAKRQTEFSFQNYPVYDLLGRLERIRPGSGPTGLIIRRFPFSYSHGIRLKRTGR
jgi:PKD repeat protein